MTPDWIKEAARDAVAMQDANESLSQAVARGMLSVAARVERETLEQCKEISRDYAGTAGLRISLALSALPRKYQEPNHE